MISSLLTILIFLVASGVAQVTDSLDVTLPGKRGQIKATVQVERSEVPQNRTLTYTVRISWHGDLERYAIGKLDNPSLSNLEIVGNSSSNWVGEVNGVKQAVKNYEFTLRPQSLGMAYIDGVLIEYEDVSEGERHTLVTSRLEVKVVAPILTTDFGGWILVGSTLLLLALLTGSGMLFVKRKRAKEAKREALAAQAEPMESTYLSELKEKVKLTNQNTGAFATLSRILRRYLSEKYTIPALGTTTAEICQELHKMAVDEKIVSSTDEVLNTCDVAKFSGGQTERGTLERIYTLLEEMLNQNKRVKMADAEKNVR